MLEPLNQLDWVSSDDQSRFWRRRVGVGSGVVAEWTVHSKIEFPMLNKIARAKILQIHARKMTVMLGLIGLSWRGARIMGPC
jgi:hypothetical protein